MRPIVIMHPCFLWFAVSVGLVAAAPMEDYRGVVCSPNDALSVLTRKASEINAWLSTVSAFLLRFSSSDHVSRCSLTLPPGFVHPTHVPRWSLLCGVYLCGVYVCVPSGRAGRADSRRPLTHPLHVLWLFDNAFA